MAAAERGPTGWHNEERIGARIGPRILRTAAGLLGEEPPEAGRRCCSVGIGERQVRTEAQRCIVERAGHTVLPEMTTECTEERTALDQSCTGELKEEQHIEELKDQSIEELTLEPRTGAGVRGPHTGVEERERRTVVEERTAGVGLDTAGRRVELPGQYSGVQGRRIEEVVGMKRGKERI